MAAALRRGGHGEEGDAAPLPNALLPEAVALGQRVTRDVKRHSPKHSLVQH